MPVLVKIEAWDPTTNVSVALCASSHDDPDVCHATGGPWWPAIAKLPVLKYDLFDGAFAGQITAPSSSLTLQTEAWPDFGRYQFADAPIEISIGEPGNWTLRFKGRVSTQPKGGTGAAEIEFAVDDKWLDGVLLNTYAGTTGAEGPAAIKGQAKPWALGAPRYVPATLVDTINSIYQISDGPVHLFEAALERLARFGPPNSTVTTYSELEDAELAAGTWAIAPAIGFLRFGAPPENPVSFLVQGDQPSAGVWARKPGELIGRIASRAGGIDKVDAGALTALDAARPYNLSLYFDQQTSARPVIQSIAASVNAVAGVSWLGKLFVLPVALGAPILTLAADGSALPPVRSVQQIEVGTPFKRLAIAAERTWLVHALSDVAFTAPLVEVGAYSATEEYREGNIVSLPDGSRWLFIATAPATGVAPGTDATKWTRLQEPVTVITPDSIIGGTYNPSTGQTEGGVPAGDIVEIIGQIGDLVDTTPPDVPTGPSATSASQLDPATGAVRIVLIATSNAATAPDLASYEFEITEQGGQALVVGSPIPRVEWAVLANTQYTVRVRSADKAGNRSAWSSSVSHTTARDTTAPSMPTGLSAQGGYTSITISWTAPSDKDLANIVVLEGSTSTSSAATAIYTAAARPSQVGAFIRSNLPNSATRFYWVKAVDTSGNESVLAGPVSASTALVPAADLQGQIQAAQIAAAAIDKTKMAAGLEVPQIVAALPATGNYRGRMVYLTTTNKLYRWNSDTTTGTSFWTAEVATTDLTGQITAAQITPASINAAHIAAGVALTERVAALPSTGNFRGRIVLLTTDGKLYRWNSDTTTGTAFWDKSTDGADILAGSVTAQQIAAGTITTDKIAVGTRPVLFNNLFDQFDAWRDDIVFTGTPPANVSWNAPASNSWSSLASPIGGAVELVMKCTGAGTDVGAGGWVFTYSDTWGFSKSKSYRYLAWVYVPSAVTGGTIYHGCQTVKDLTIRNGGAANGNPYFFSIAATSLPKDRWLLMVGVVHSGGSGLGDSGLSGIYDPITGQRIVTGIDFRWNDDVGAGNSGSFRTYYFYAPNGSITFFSKPALEEITSGIKSIPALLEAFDPAAAINVGVTTIDGGKLTTGSVTALQIAAKSITTAKLTVAPGNLVANSDFATGDFTNWRTWSGNLAVLSRDTTGVPAGAPSQYVARYQNTSGASNISAFNGSFAYTDPLAFQDGIAVTPGQEYLVGISAVRSSDYTSDNFRVYAYFGLADGTLSPAVLAMDLKPSLTTSWQDFSGSFVVPANAIRCWLYVYSQNQSVGALYWTNLRCWLKAGADLIVNGSVTATKIAAASITGDRLVAGTITGALLAANTVTADKLLVQVSGSALNSDPTFSDATAWTSGGGTPNFVTNSSGPAGNRAVILPTNTQIFSRAVPVDRNKTYRIHFYANGTGTMYGGVGLQDASGAEIAGDGSYWLYSYNAVPGGGWIESSYVFGAGTARPIPVNAKTMKVVFLGGYAGSPSNAIQDARIEEVLPSTLIQDGAITTDKVAANAITAGKVAANAITATNIVAGTITGDRLAAGTITAASIAAGTITGDRIAAGTLTGDKIAGNTITANKLTIGTRGLNVIDVTFQVAANSASLSWTAGFIQYYDNNGNFQQVSISAGNTSLASYVYIYWTQGSSTLSATNTAATAFGPNTVCVATWQAGSKVITQTYGSTIIDGSRIVTGSVTATQIAAGTITGDRIAAGTITGSRLAAATITAANIAAATITGDKVAAGTIAADRLNVTSLSAITATIGLLRTATTGERMEIDNNQLRVYYANGQLALELGILS